MKLIHSILAVSLSAIFMSDVSAAEISPELLSSIQSVGKNENIPVIIRFQDRVNVHAIKADTRSQRRSNMIKALQLKASQSQKNVRQQLDATLDKNQSQTVKQLWMINALAVSLPAQVIEALARHQDIDSITLDAEVLPNDLNVAAAVEPEWNLIAIGANSLWDMGYTGQNTVIASMDSGVDAQHQDLQSRWRGGDNSWFDPYGQHTSPYDAYGHGTQTMGIAVGGDAGGTAIGVAPGAKWISVKIFNDAGTGTISRIHQGFQWLLDPDNNPDTDDAPDVINNSWNLQESVNSCNTEFQNDIDVLRYADIAVVFSAGNTGPYESSSISPANNAGSFESGAVDQSLNVVFSSGRGPSACDGGIYPQVSAPGFNVRTSDLTFGGAIPDLYTTVSGTSFAVAHVSGAMALLRSALPGAGIDAIEAAITQTAVDAGAAGADNDYGWGVIDVAAAYQQLQSSVEPPVVPPDEPPVAEPNLAPVANDDTASTVKTRPVTIDLLANDIDPDGSIDPTSIVIVTAAKKGATVINADGSVTYTAIGRRTGSDSFSYQVADNEGAVSNVATVTVTILKK